MEEWRTGYADAIVSVRINGKRKTSDGIERVRSIDAPPARS